MKAGILYLIPSLLGENKSDSVLPKRNFEIMSSLSHFVAENKRSAIRFLKKALPEIDIDALQFYELSEHTAARDAIQYVRLLEKGVSLGVISEAGCPCIADPGALLTEAAHKKKIRVVPLVGPSSVLLSLMASGFNGQAFSFHGYLPAKENERAKKLLSLEKKMRTENATQIFIETPYRNMQLFETCIKNLHNETKLCIACNLTAADECIQTKTIADWKKCPPSDIQKKPAIFLLYR